MGASSDYCENAAISEAQAKKEFSKLEEEFLKNGGVFENQTTVSKFVSIALELEEAQ